MLCFTEVYSRHPLYQHFLAHSWTFLSASGQGAKPVQEIHPEGVFVWVFDRSHSWRRADWTFMITTDNILEVVHWWIIATNPVACVSFALVRVLVWVCWLRIGQYLGEYTVYLSSLHANMQSSSFYPSEQEVDTNSKYSIQPLSPTRPEVPHAMSPGIPCHQDVNSPKKWHFP